METTECEWCGESNLPHPQCLEAEAQCEREKDYLRDAESPRGDERELEWCRIERAWVLT